MMIEVLSQLMMSRGTTNLRNRMNQQLIYDVFFQNLLVIQNFFVATEMQQREFVCGTRSMKSDTHMISVALQLTQKMMLWWPQLMRVMQEQPDIETLFEIVFLKLDTDRL